MNPYKSTDWAGHLDEFDSVAVREVGECAVASGDDVERRHSGMRILTMFYTSLLSKPLLSFLQARPVTSDFKPSHGVFIGLSGPV